MLERTKGQSITATEIRRQQISELLDTGLTPSKVGAIMDCCPRTIFKIVKMKRSGESLALKPISGRPSIRTEEFVGKLNELRAANPNITQAAMAKKLGVSSKTVERALKDDN